MPFGSKKGIQEDEEAGSFGQNLQTTFCMNQKINPKINYRLHINSDSAAAEHLLYN